MKIFTHDTIPPSPSLINIPLKIKFVQMLNQLKSFLSSSPPAKPQLPPPCNHPYYTCTHQTYCLRTLGEETISLLDVHSIDTLTKAGSRFATDVTRNAARTVRAVI
jgi:hypothetical protein